MSQEFKSITLAFFENCWTVESLFFCRDRFPSPSKAKETAELVGLSIVDGNSKSQSINSPFLICFNILAGMAGGLLLKFCC